MRDTIFFAFLHIAVTSCLWASYELLTWYKIPSEVCLVHPVKLNKTRQSWQEMSEVPGQMLKKCNNLQVEQMFSLIDTSWV